MRVNTIPMESFPGSVQLEIDRKQQLSDYGQKWADFGATLVNLYNSGIQPWIRGMSDLGFRGYQSGSNMELSLRVDAQNVSRSAPSGYGRFTRAPHYGAMTRRNDDLSIITGISRAVVRLDNYKIKPEEVHTVGVNGEVSQITQGTAFSEPHTDCELPSLENDKIQSWAPETIAKHSKVLDGLILILSNNSVEWRS